jgi:ATP-dependent exoDNAse (exonuclease V) beta subunit
MLDSVLFPEPRRRRDARVAEGCPRFGGDSVLERPANVARDADGAVQPGLHIAHAGNEVVWWDPAALELGRDLEGGLRQQRILAADASTLASEEAFLAHEAWAENRSFVLARGATKTLPVRSVTEASKAPRDVAPLAWSTREKTAADTLAPVELADTGVDKRGRPQGLRFGSLVHAVLAAVALDADEVAVLTVARTEGRLLSASAREVEAAAEAAVAALAHPVLRRAAESAKRGTCRRESPVILPGRGGELLEGVIDLAFREPDGWTVVDFKTDAELAGRKARYETQVLLYVEAVRAATGEGARGVLLTV